MKKNYSINISGNVNIDKGDFTAGDKIVNQVADNRMLLVEQTDMLLHFLEKNNDKSVKSIEQAKLALECNNEKEAISLFKKSGKTIITIATTIGATILAEWLKLNVFQ